MSDGQAGRILLVDDEETVLVIVGKMVEAENYAVETASSAREALAMLPSKQYDGILCDMWMPGMTGKEFYEQASLEYPEYTRRFIFLTADVASEATWDFIEDKQLPYVLKPVNINELRRRLREVVGEAPPRAVAPGVARGAESRRHKRVAMKTQVRVRKKKWAASVPEIANVINASKTGVYFESTQQYQVGIELLVVFPYTGTTDFEQEGMVVRVDEKSGGQRGVAVAVGEAAAEARAILAVPDDPMTKRVLSLAEMEMDQRVRTTAAPLPEDAADLKRQMAAERERANRLSKELADLKMVYERLADERDRLQKEGETAAVLFDREAATVAGDSELIQGLRDEVDTLRFQLTASEVQRDEDAAARKKIVNDLQAQVDKLHEELAALNAERGQKSLQVKELEGQVESQLLAADVERTQRVQLQRLNQEQEAELQRLREQLAAVESQATELNDLRGRLAAAQADRQEMSDQLKASHAESNEKAEMLRAIEGQRETLRKQLSAAELRRSQKEAMQRQIDEQQRQIETLRSQLEAVEAAAAKAPAGKTKRHAAESEAAAAQQLAHLREEIESLQATVQELRKSGVRALTVMAGHCDLLAMNKSLDAEIHQTVQEIAQQAALLRSLFQKLQQRKR